MLIKKVIQDNIEKKLKIIQNISKGYLYKDILKLNKIKHSDALNKLLQAIAWGVNLNNKFYTKLRVR
ncbi:MAG: hypothetical protein KAT05_14425 [Spirochaetes bacterium]|nr:hypothetical protein [Spirochaetota bacterium]